MMHTRTLGVAICGLIAFSSLTLVPQTAAQEDPMKSLVARLDLEKYKATMKGLTQFGDRREGTESNRKAMEWIKAQLESYRCFTDRVRYEYQPPSNAEASQAGLREQVFCTKIGTSGSEEGYIVSAHMDGLGGEAADDNGSGAAIVMELARIFSMPDVQTRHSVRFVFWNNHETGQQGARAYIDQRREMQGKEDYPGSGNYPEPRWLGLIELDMMLWDHHRPQADADVNIEYQSTAKLAQQSLKLATLFRDANMKYATDFRAAVGSYATAIETTPFLDLIPSISLSGSERGTQITGRNPHWHQQTDLYSTYNDNDFRLGLNAAQTTAGAIGQLAVATLKQ
jgi:hypothetical protein